MKKILKISALLSLFFVIALTMLQFKDADDVIWKQYSGDSAYKQEIYLINTGMEKEVLYEALTSSAIASKVNLIKSDLVGGEDSKIIKSIYIGNEDVTFLSSLHLISGRLLTMSDMSSDAFLSSKSKGVSNQSGILYDLFDDTNIEMNTLLHYKDTKPTMDGVYEVNSISQGGLDQFIRVFSEKSGISVETLTTKKSFEVTNQNPQLILAAVGIVICILVFLVLAIYYGVSQLKKVGVLKLLGYNNLDIWKELLFDVFLLLVSSIILTSIMLMLVLHNIAFYVMLRLWFMEALLIIMLLLASFVIYLLIKSNSLNSLLKNSQPIKVVSVLTIVIKNIVFFILVFTTSVLPIGLKELEKEYNVYHAWQQVENYIVLEGYSMDQDLESLKGLDLSVDNKFEKLYDYFNSKGSIYTKVEALTYSVDLKIEQNEQTNELEYPSEFDEKVASSLPESTQMLINPNYLKEFALYDLQGNRIVVEEDSNDIIVLVPNTMKSKIDAVKMIYTTFEKTKLEAQNRKDTSKMVTQSELQFLFYNDTDVSSFAFEMMEDNETNMLNDVVFVVKNQQVMLPFEKSNIRIQGLNSPLKVKLQEGESMEQFQQQIDVIASALELTQNKIKFVQIKEYFESQIESIKQVCLNYMMAAGLVLLLGVFMSVQSINLLLDARKKKLMIQKLNGFGFVERHKQMLFFTSSIQAIVMLISVLLSTAVLGGDLSLLSFVIAIAVFTIDLIVNIIIINFIERKNMSNMLKGE